MYPVRVPGTRTWYTYRYANQVGIARRSVAAKGAVAGEMFAQAGEFVVGDSLVDEGCPPSGAVSNACAQAQKLAVEGEFLAPFPAVLCR